MKVSVEWLNSFLTEKLDVHALADAMELAGIEVEEVVQAQPLDERIIVGKIVEAVQHPNADKLKITKVDVKNATLSIVCGAPNVAVGMVVPVATVGAVLPDGTVIKAAKLRGEESQGMICSERELGVSENHEGIMPLDPKTAIIGQPAREIITTHDVIDVKTAANRWDLNSIIGMAREVAAQTTQKLAKDYPEHINSSNSKVTATVQQPELATRYMLALISVDRSQPSPQWLRDRLQAEGIRSINAIVDITNYVMVEYGQPLHAFDAAKVTGSVQVRHAKAGEKLTTLDGVERTLVTEDIVIADDKKAVGLAGVMGGENSEIDDKTTEILLEAASFHPASLRKTAIRYGLRTDASARFERGIPAELPPRALQAALQLLTEIAGAKLVGGPADVSSKLNSDHQVVVDAQKVSELLGISLKPGEISKQITRLDFTAAVDGDMVTIDVPWWRPDIQGQADIAEEIIKLIGYEKLPATIPALRVNQMQFDQRWARLWQAKAVLRSMGLFEVSTYSFIGAQQIEDLGWKTDMYLKLKNPLSSEQAYLRRTMLPSLLAAAGRNRMYAKQFGMFEFSKTFWKTRDGELPQEPTYLAALTVSPDNGYRSVKAIFDRLTRDFNLPAEVVVEPKDFAPGVSHPTRSAVITVKGEQVGAVAQLHPAVAKRAKVSGEIGFIELNWPRLMELAAPVTAQPLNRYPVVERDLSFLLDRTVTWAEIKKALSDISVSFLSDYYGEDLPQNKKSMAIRVTLSADDHTLTDAEADEQLAAITQMLADTFKAEPRI